MLKLKTKTEFTARTDRGFIQTIIYFIIDGIFIDKNNITPKGYYYWYDSDGKMYDSKISEPTLLQNVKLAENNNVVPLLKSNKNIEDNLIQRLKEFTKLQMISEEPNNFGTVADDWIEDND